MSVKEPSYGLYLSEQILTISHVLQNESSSMGKRPNLQNEIKIAERTTCSTTTRKRPNVLYFFFFIAVVTPPLKNLTIGGQSESDLTIWLLIMISFFDN